MPPSGSVALACPETGQSVEAVALDGADGVGASLQPIRRLGTAGAPVGRTPTVLLRSDGMRAYPVVDDIPVMLVPEALVDERSGAAVDLADPKYAEAYEEREHYDRVAIEEAKAIEGSDLSREIEHLRVSSFDPDQFPAPRRAYIDAPYEPTAQWRAFEHLAPLTGKTMLQLGGRGMTSVKLLFAGLSEAWLLTPMLGEALYAQELARRHGVGDRLRCVVGVAEELPFHAESFDVTYSVGCVHHMITDLAFAEMARVLRSGGRFAAVEPWRSPGYAAGVRLLGKREAVHCRPLTADRLTPLGDHFASWEVSHHGALTRYPLLALNKLGVWLGMDAMWRITRADDRISALVPPLRRSGSAVAVLAAKR